MLSMEERTWIEGLIEGAVQRAVQAEMKMVEVAIEAHARSDEHIAFRSFIADVERKRAMWEKIQTSVVGAAIIGVLYWVGSNTIEIATWIVRSSK